MTLNTGGISENTIAEAEAGALPTIIAELHRLAALALAKLIRPTQTEKSEPEPVLLTALEAATLVNVNPVALRRSQKFRSARRVLGARTLRFDRTVLLRIAGRS